MGSHGDRRGRRGRVDLAHAVRAAAHRARGRVRSRRDHHRRATTPRTILASVEWMAPGFEIVQCVFPGWRFTAADCTAAFGLHGALVVGTPVAVNARDRAAIAERLATFTATFSRDGSMVEQGSGANVLGSPALALGHLARIVARDSRSSRLRHAERSSRPGTLTDARQVKHGGAVDLRLRRARHRRAVRRVHVATRVTPRRPRIGCGSCRCLRSSSRRFHRVEGSEAAWT